MFYPEVMDSWWGYERQNIHKANTTTLADAIIAVEEKSYQVCPFTIPELDFRTILYTLHSSQLLYYMCFP